MAFSVKRDKVKIWQRVLRLDESKLGTLSELKRKMDGHKYRTVLQENLFKSVTNLWLGRNDNDPKHKAKMTQQWLKTDK